MDGMVLMVDGERRQSILKNLSAKKRAKAKKGIRISELTACTEFYLNTDDEKEIKQRINEKALELNGTYCREINRALDMPANRDLTTAEAFQSRGEKFIADITRNCSSERSRTQLLRLERLCCELSYKEMSNITAEDIRSLLKKMAGNDKTKRQKLTLLGRFWNYCLKEKLTSGINPVESFQSDYPGMLRGKRRAAVAENKEGSLESEQREKLYHHVEQHLDDGRAISICLLNGGYIAPSMQVGLTWSDVEFRDGPNGSDVRVHIKNEQVLGATHDFTRPLFRQEGHLLIMRYTMLQKIYGEALRDMPVVSVKDEPKEPAKAKELTAYIRDALLRAGVRNSLLAPSTNPNPRIGMGTQLLQHDYRKRLLECGLETDQGLQDFLLMQRIRSVTADYYRSFTSEEGQRYIRCRLDRWVDPTQRIVENAEEPEIHLEGESKSVKMFPAGVACCNQLDGQIKLKKGQRIVLRSEAGISGQLQIMRADATPAPLHVIEVY